uniref:B box-type domain-containing protein n=1 Tax=Thermogladius calderae TaxID=1200300 RepID=A0A7J3Y0L3_9CREN
MSENSFLCEICGLNPAVVKCPVCGRFVCEDDFDYEKNMCLVCSNTRCEICGKKPSIGYCRVCGRVGCEDCLIEETPVSYVCRECAGKIGLELNAKKLRYKLR